MNNKLSRRNFLALSAAASAAVLAGCGGGGEAGHDVDHNDVSIEDVTLPLAETATITALTNFPVGTEPDPNKRTIFKRLEEETNVHIDWRTIQSDQWGDKIALEMSNINTLPDLIFNAGFGDTELLKYAKQGVIIPLEELIDKFMPNLQAVFAQAPEYRTMCTDENGHIWGFPWIEQLGYEKTAIQVIGNMPFINKWWLDFLGLPVPSTVEEFESTLQAFKDNAAKLKSEFGIDGDIIPMSCIMNDGSQDHGLYEKGLIDAEAFTQEWATYVAKGKSGRYGVCFTWDVANIAQVSMDDLIAGKGWVPLPALKADTVNITPETGSFTSGFQRGRCVITGVAKNPALIASWIDKMYDPIQSAQNNWGTYGEDDEFDIFEMSTNAAGEPMLKHTWLGDASPVEVREAESVNGPLAILDSYYDVYVTCPDDAKYRLDWIKNVYTPDMNFKYCYPNAFMSTEDTTQVSNLMADIMKCINTFKSDAVMNGFDDAAWNKLQSDLEGYKLQEFIDIHQKYFDAYNA